MVAGNKFRNFFGPSRYYPDACVELTFDAPARPVSLAPLAPLCGRLRLWQGNPPGDLLPEEAIGRIASRMINSHVAGWCRFRREGSTGVVAVGTFSALFVAALLQALQRALLGLPEQRAQALNTIAGLERTLADERTINWAILQEARRRALESHWILPQAQLFQIGLGAQNKHFCQLSSHVDSATGWLVAKSKYNTIEMLRMQGFPTTRAVLMRTEADAPFAIRKIGFPCVVKPLLLSKGKGITTRVVNQEELEQAIRLAIQAGAAPVLVENHVEGIDHRIMVIDGKVLWTYSKVPASITGDGSSTVATLVERENVRRNEAREGTLTLLEPIELKGDLPRFLARRYGFGLDHVLAAGDRIDLAGQSNISLGGILADVTPQLHPDNRQLAIDIADALRLDVVGIDFMTTDISCSWKECDCAVIEINTTPGLSGEGDAALAIRALFPRSRSGRIPVLVAIGSEEFRAGAANWLLEASTGAGARTRLVEWRLPPKGGPLRDRPPAFIRAMLDTTLEAMVLSCDPDAIEELGFPVLHADLIVAEDVAAWPFLDHVADEVMTLPETVDAVADKVSEIVAAYTLPASHTALPIVCLHAPTGESEHYGIECSRFAALPRSWFYRELDLPVSANEGMLDFADVFGAIDTLANAALEQAGHPRLATPTRFTHPGPGWETRAVTGSVDTPGYLIEELGAALATAVDAVNAVMCKGPGRRGMMPLAHGG